MKVLLLIFSRIIYLYYLLLPRLISLPHKITSAPPHTPEQQSSLLLKPFFLSPDIPHGKISIKVALFRVIPEESEFDWKVLKHTQALTLHEDPDFSLGSSGTLFS